MDSRILTERNRLIGELGKMLTIDTIEPPYDPSIPELQGRHDQWKAGYSRVEKIANSIMNLAWMAARIAVEEALLKTDSEEEKPEEQPSRPSQSKTTTPKSKSVK